MVFLNSMTFHDPGAPCVKPLLPPSKARGPGNTSQLGEKSVGFRIAWVMLY